MGLTREELLEIARRHANSEAERDMATTLATLDPDPAYELQPVGLVFRGMPAVRRYYEHFFASFQPMIQGYTMRSEWRNDEGLGQEYRIDLRLPDGRTESHHVIGILLFGETGLAGERLYASERLLRLLCGPAYALAEPIGGQEP